MPKPTDQELENRFIYHPPKTDSRRAKHQKVTDMALALAKEMTAICPEGRGLAYFFFAEKADGKDKLGTTRWVDVTDAAKSFHDLVRSIGKAMVRREKAMRKARRAGK